MLAFLILFPFVMFASKISRNYHLWGCDVVYKRVNKELFLVAYCFGSCTIFNQYVAVIVVFL